MANARFEIDFIKNVTEDKSTWKALIDIRPINANYSMNLLPYLYLSYEGNGL